MAAMDGRESGHEQPRDKSQGRMAVMEGSRERGSRDRDGGVWSQLARPRSAEKATGRGVDERRRYKAWVVWLRSAARWGGQIGGDCGWACMVAVRHDWAVFGLGRDERLEVRTAVPLPRNGGRTGLPLFHFPSYFLR
ncbi:hypothetical protein SESBI_10720 [Sesbania bispinosa]|nr:hypothetical protein SESBI_10720 [Sesbania bispinosa]